MNLSILTIALAINIIPQPLKVVQKEGTLEINAVRITVDKNAGQTAKKAISLFSEELAPAKGPGKKTPIKFSVNPELAAQEYTIAIDAEGVKVGASQDAGFIYAIQSLKQLLFAGNHTLPYCEIADKPAFGYRGIMLDCARHFFSIDEIKKIMDAMCLYKINRLHWHLSDDQGWRIEVKAYPELTRIGAWRKGTQNGYDRNSCDNIRYGGFYTQQEVKDLIAYAAVRGITIIPEIDLPGHMAGALAAFPELGCTGGPYEVLPKWGIMKDVLCPGNEKTFEFLETVLGELAELFPGEYFNIGGDECPKDRWRECPKCQAKIAELGLKDDENASKEQRLQNYVTNRIQAFLATKGKKIIGWDEILEGELAKGAVVMSWRGPHRGIKAANMGYDVIMSPNNFCYLDYAQSADLSQEPLGITRDPKRAVSLEKIYSFNPFDQLDQTASKHIIGVQANLWTEYIASEQHLEYMLLPRMLAISEVQWANENRPSFEEFDAKLDAVGFPILDSLGFTYRPRH